MFKVRNKNSRIITSTDVDLVSTDIDLASLLLHWNNIDVFIKRFDKVLQWIRCSFAEMPQNK